jgi:hypothetical protein
MRRSPLPPCAVLLVAAILAVPLLLLACSDEAQFTTRFASDFAHADHAVSVLGVFRDGRMSSDAWDVVGPPLSAPFGKTCETAYGALIGTAPGLSSAIDDYVRANGPGDELLEQLAPAATGDVILVFTVAGHIAVRAAPSDSAAASPAAPGAAMGGGKYRGPHQAGSMGRALTPATNTAPLEVSVSLYSVATHRSVGLIGMGYDGVSLTEALQRMASRLGLALPKSRCAGWDWGKGTVSEAKIRELIEH